MAAPDFEGQRADQHESLLRQTLACLRQFIVQERRLLIILIQYAVVVGFFSLIVPLTVQEMVNTFAFAIQPIMVATLIAIMAAVLLFRGAFRVLQFYATDVLERRLFVRVTLALASQLLRFRQDSFRVKDINHFFETVFMQRALSSLLVDFINIVVGGIIGMTLLVFYHPYFLFFNFFLVGSAVVIALLGRGGLKATLRMSEAKYDTFQWFQDVANNLLDFKTTRSASLVLGKADSLSESYVDTRKSRFRILVRQYAGWVLLQVMIHSGLLGMAGWLVAIGQLTVGQLVAAEVIMVTLLVNLESVVKRTYVIFYFFTALVELDHLLALPKDPVPLPGALDLATPGMGSVKVSCHHVLLSVNGVPLLRNAHFEVGRGEKWGVVCESETVRHLLSCALAGVAPPDSGAIRYDDVNLRNLEADTVNAYRGLVLSWQISLFEGTLEDNITMGREGVLSEDVLWALRLVELAEHVESLPGGLKTRVGFDSKEFTLSQKLEILVARAIVAHPPLLILDGALVQIRQDIREVILQRLCSPDQPWSVIIVTSHPEIRDVVEHCIQVS